MCLHTSVWTSVNYIFVTGQTPSVANWYAAANGQFSPDSPQHNATTTTPAWPSVPESLPWVGLGVTVYCILALPRITLWIIRRLSLSLNCPRLMEPEHNCAASELEYPSKPLDFDDIWPSLLTLRENCLYLKYYWLDLDAFYTAMYLTGFYKSNKSGHIWPWLLTLKAKIDGYV